MTDKSGWLQVKIKSGKKISISSGSGKRQWVVLLDHFLFVYKSPTDMAPKRVVSLENHAVRLERFGKGVHLVISRTGENNETPYPTVVLGSTEGSNILYDWLSAMEKTCYHIAGKEHVFGAELSLARSGLPIVVEKCAIFLMAYNSNTKDLFFEPGNRAMIEYFKLQFDQGGEVEFTQYNTDAHTVAQLLKLYISQLPSPLLPWIPTLASGGKREALHQVVASIDSAYRTVLGVVLGLIGARYLSEEKVEIDDNRQPGDYWRIFLRVPEGHAITLEDEHNASIAINELIINQDSIFVGFKESTISRRLRVKKSARKNTSADPGSVCDSPGSWKIELANSANSVKHTAVKQKARIEEAKALIEEQFGLMRRARAFSDSGENEIIDKDAKPAAFPGHSRRVQKNMRGGSFGGGGFPLSPSPQGSLPHSAESLSSSSASSASSPLANNRAPSVPALKLTTDSSSSSAPDSPSIPDSSSFSRSLPMTFADPYLSSSPPTSSPISSLPPSPSSINAPPSPSLPRHKPRSLSVPIAPGQPASSSSPSPTLPLAASLSPALLVPPSSSSPPTSPPSSPPNEQPNRISPRGTHDRTKWVRRLTKRNLGSPDLNWGRACENCGKSFALNGEIACKGCGFVPNQEGKAHATQFY